MCSGGLRPPHKIHARFSFMCSTPACLILSMSYFLTENFLSNSFFFSDEERRISALFLCLTLITSSSEVSFLFLFLESWLLAFPPEGLELSRADPHAAPIVYAVM
jgi:hypothetical protein